MVYGSFHIPFRSKGTNITRTLVRGNQLLPGNFRQESP